MLRPSIPFLRLVNGLKEKGKTCTVVESCCGGLINASIMAIPGSSAVYYGGSIAYNTRRAKKLLLNDTELHSKLLDKNIHSSSTTTTQTTLTDEYESDEANAYIQSKRIWTEETAKAFCEQLDVDYAIAEGGASGPTFRPKGLTTGFAVIAIAGRDEKTGKGRLLAQTTIRSNHANRQENMELFADAAATFAAKTIGIQIDTTNQSQNDDDSSSLSGVSRRVGGISDGNHNMEVWLDRASHIRRQPDVLKELENHPDAAFVVLRDSKDCLFASDSQLSLVKHVAPQIPKTFLGLDPKGSPIFSVDISSNKEQDINSENIIEMPPESYFDNIRTHAPLLNPKDNELALYATAMAQWKRTHKFCSTCGGVLQPIQGGTCLECSTPGGCKSHWWPRQDPSIIVLVTNREGNKALLARSARHPPKMHTTLAGFVEAGETFEKAVMRETLEETGARVDPDSITYLGSQPWPFPRSCMIGFRATANDEIPLEIDPNEIVSASWFDKHQVAAASQVPGAVMNHDVAKSALERDPTLELLIPPKGVIARKLIDSWLSDSGF